MICNAKKSLMLGRREGPGAVRVQKWISQYVLCVVELREAYHLSAALQMPCVPSPSQNAPFVFGNR